MNALNIYLNTHMKEKVHVTLRLILDSNPSPGLEKLPHCFFFLKTDDFSKASSIKH